MSGAPPCSSMSGVPEDPIGGGYGRRQRVGGKCTTASNGTEVFASVLQLNKKLQKSLEFVFTKAPWCFFGYSIHASKSSSDRSPSGTATTIFTQRCTH
uniref:Uncharacterized protein n=1 Tax=Aegilops tauschii TaxID=37682 RepID=M8B1W9_AEGTA